jgi:hypothetical protein
MKRLLCWCIWLLVIENGQLRIDNFAATQIPVFIAPQSTLRPLHPKFSILNFQLPINTLPCTDSSPTCLNALSDLAVQNSRELVVLEQAIQLQKKTLWTNWLSADGLNPLAIGLRIVRNVAGGGDRAAAKLEIARLELRRNEVATELRHTILQALLWYESAERHIHDAQAKWMTHRNRVELLSIAYRLGEGSTETMLQLWQTETELQREVENAQLACQQRFVLLQSLVIPSSTSKPIPISQSHK